MVALAGQVGSQIKIRVGDAWLLASVRDQRKDRRTEGGIIANIDFLGEGSEEKLTGRIHGFKRGVTRYPIPGAMIYPATTRDLEQIYASDGRASITIGKVFPTKDIRAGLYIDAMLGKHFALLGSTGTGKSTAAALILHRICDMMPDGHIVMIDPHGEYSSAFAQNGELFDVGNLAMPYWLMNFEEHCEVFLTSHGAEDHRFDLSLWPWELEQLTPQRLGALLDAAGIRHRVILVSACYSGGFVPPLAGPDTLVMSASRADRNSHGCSHEADWTFFGRAFFDEALRETTSFTDAFERARAAVAQRESAEGLEPSEPQIAVGETIRSRLADLAAGWQARPGLPSAQAAGDANADLSPPPCDGEAAQRKCADDVNRR